MTTVTRRRLLRTATGAAALGLLPSATQAAPQKGGDDFAFFLLGDLHLDKLDHHDRSWLMAEKPGDLRQIENYSRITREVVPSLLAELKQHAASDPRIAFTTHIGDFVEGLAGTPDLAARQARESIALVSAHGPAKPFLFCKGNHDITGPGAETAWNDILMPYVAGQASVAAVDRSCFTVRHGSDTLFAYYDAYKPESLDWLEVALAKRTEKRLFVVIHPPVVPYSARSDWHLFAKPAEAALRERLLNLLGKNRAIVLCGHLHKYGTVVRETPTGRFVQVATLSVIPRAGVTPKDRREGVASYGPGVVTLEPEFSPKTRESRKQLLAAEAPYVRHFEYADATGYGIVSVKGEAVMLDLYTGLGKRKWRTLDLSALIA
ncbi:MAG: metallophosphoesterase [Cytophagales bacterium]|nr:metallophosphoesterase [Armatimonadota bacterium]